MARSKPNPKKRRQLKRTPLPGTTSVCFQLPEALDAFMHKIWKARHYAEGSDPRLCRIYTEAVEHYVQGFDPETGLPKKKPQRRARRSNERGRPDAIIFEAKKHSGS